MKSESIVNMIDIQLVHSAKTAFVFRTILCVALLELANCSFGDRSTELSQYLENRDLDKRELNISADSFIKRLTDEAPVRLYDTVEIKVENSKTFSNPFDYSQVELKASFVSPSKKEYKVYGFYDGTVTKDGGTVGLWKVRFMPDEIGDWDYSCQWEAQAKITNGKFRVNEKPGNLNHGHVRVDALTKKHLRHDDGKPHYWIGGKWFSARDYGPYEKQSELNYGFDRPNVSYGRKTDDQILDYLDQLYQFRHNGILLKIALYPLENDGVSWDLDWIQRAEWLVHEALKRGIYVQVNLFDTWSRNKDFWFQNSTSGTQHPFNVWNDGEEHKKRNYIRSIVARFAGFANVYWELGNEMEHKPNSGRRFVELANDYYLKWIREDDPYDLPIGLSEGVWRDTSADIAFFHQTNKLPDDSLDRPAIMNELVRGGMTLSLLDKFLGKKEGLWRDQIIRSASNRIAYRRAFWRMFATGGSGTSEATWLNLDKPFNSAVYDVMYDHMVLAEFLHNLDVDFNTMKANKSMVIEKPGTAYMRFIEGELYVVYFLKEPDAESYVNHTKIKLRDGHYRFEWFSPVDNEVVVSGFVYVDNGLLSLKTPNFVEDIVLTIRKQLANQ